MKNQFETYDLWLATLLKVKGFRLFNVRTNGDNRSLFVFEDQPERQQLLMDYVNRKTQVEPMAFVNEMKGLKALTYQ